jgi:Icc-related predicted phosphoesterase
MLAVLSPATAQPPRGGGGMMRNPAMLLQQESVRKELKLSDEQTKKVEEFGASMREKMQEAFNLEGEERTAKMQEIMKEAEKTVSGILNADQSKRLKQVGYQIAGPGAFNMPDVVSALKITDDQKKQIQEINQDLNAQRRELFQGGPPDEDTMKKMQAMTKEATEKAVKVLTEDQQKQWKEMTGEPFKGEIRFGPRRGGQQ